MKSKDMEIEIEFEDLVIDEDKGTITLQLQTENHDYGFTKVIPLNDETDTPEKLRAYLEKMTPAIAEELNYKTVTFAFETCGYICRPDMITTYNEDELGDMSKSDLLDAATKTGAYTDDMEKTKFTKAMVIEAILEGQEPEEPEE